MDGRLDDSDVGEKDADASYANYLHWDANDGDDDDYEKNKGFPRKRKGGKSLAMRLALCRAPLAISRASAAIATTGSQ